MSIIVVDDFPVFYNPRGGFGLLRPYSSSAVGPERDGVGVAVAGERIPLRRCQANVTDRGIIGVIGRSGVINNRPMFLTSRHLCGDHRRAPG